MSQSAVGQPVVFSGEWDDAFSTTYNTTTTTTSTNTLWPTIVIPIPNNNNVWLTAPKEKYMFKSPDGHVFLVINGVGRLIL